MLSLAALGRGGEKRRRKRDCGASSQTRAPPSLTPPVPRRRRSPARARSPGCGGAARPGLRAAAGRSGFCPKVTPLSDSGTSPEGLREGRLPVTPPPRPGASWRSCLRSGPADAARALPPPSPRLPRQLGGRAGDHRQVSAHRGAGGSLGPPGTACRVGGRARSGGVRGCSTARFGVFS